ncbi:ribonuclease III [Edaphobacter albus]|uniref:ribonuclease III n=1 Tax=Edaphobacter sp. 4G125 TaxID=2763071 RepID=UPI0016456BAC|nr:ribonuclease III [Edaphobacter sp. 4G125]QNI37937.1 ribonuclease III [Edaphobacter sp. 4G125]
MSTRRRKPTKAPSNLPLTPLWEHRFKRPELLTLALTHRSLAYETNPETLLDPSADNEQLEFVGDAVLGLAVAESLYRRFPRSREGELTRLRASLVSRRHLGSVAQRIGLGAMLRLGRGEEQSGGRQKPALLANALEAVIAALYLDGGLEVARSFIERHIIEPSLPTLQGALNAGDTFSGAIGDHKSALQEHLQASGYGQPQYVLTAQSGPDHQKLFRIEVRISDGSGGSRALAESEGTTKKQAQQQAARIAFERLLAEQDPSQIDESTSKHSPGTTSAHQSI